MATLEKLTELIVERLGVEAGDVTMDASFKEDLGADSLDIVEFIMELEEAFEVEIPDEEAEKLVTVGDAVRYLDANK